MYYEDGTKVEFAYDALRNKVSRTQSYYDPDKIDKAAKSHGQGKGISNPNRGKGLSLAMMRGNGEKKGLFDQLLSEETTRYLYDGLNVMKEYGENGEPLAQYYEAGDQVVARKMFGLHGRKSDSYEGNIQTRGGLMYYMNDALGNVMDVTDRTGDTVMKYRYDAFGNLFTQMAAPYNTTGFTGKMYDAKASLMDFSARWYSPKHGRFTTADSYPGNPNFPATMNRYAYVGNNPVNYTDPTGNYYLCQATINGTFYSHAPPCDDDNHLVYYPDPVSNNDSDSGSGGGTSGGSYTPPPPTPEEIKSNKRSQLVSQTGTAKSKKSAISQTGTTKKVSYGYTKKPSVPKIQKTTSSGKAWSSQFTGKITSNKYKSLMRDFLDPKKGVAKPASKKGAGTFLKGGAKAVYDFVIGDSIRTLKDPHASTFSKAVAGLDIASNFIPVGAITKFTGKLAFKGAVKLGGMVTKLFKAPTKAAVKAVKDSVTGGVKKAFGWVKGLFGKSAKGTRYVNNTKGLADDIGSKLGGTINNAKGKGYKVQIPNGNKPITVRVMEAGSGGRNKPYFRVSIDGKGSLTLDGKISNDRSLSHIDITDDALKQIDIMIKAYKGK